MARPEALHEQDAPPAKAGPTDASPTPDVGGWKEPGLLDHLQDQFGSAPWWATSAAVHVTLVLLTMLLVIGIRQRPPEETLVPLSITRIQKPPPRSDIPPQIKPQEVDLVLTEDPLDLRLFREVEETEKLQTDNDEPTEFCKGQSEDFLSNVPEGGEAVCGTLGVGGPPGGAFGTRWGGHQSAGYALGMSKNVPPVRDAALRWLVRNQEPDGSWSIRKHEGAFTESGNVAVTGLALLAFLGAGQTDRIGEHRATVSRAINFLIGKQQANGALGENNGPESGWSVGGGYNHLIAGLALVEAYGMSPTNSRAQTAAQKAVDYACNIHQTQGSGWRYKPGIAPDLSVSGWGAMMLKSARICKLQVPESSFLGALKFVDSVSTKAGGDYGGGLAAYQPGEKPTPMTASMGLVCRIFLGEPKGSPSITASADLLQKNLPQWGKDVGDTGGCQFYYWYYGTLGMFQLYGAYWEAWNPAMRDMLVQHQRRGGDADGSWDPVGARDGRRGGRAYATAMGLLCLEIYYRYGRMYED